MPSNNSRVRREVRQAEAQERQRERDALAPSEQLLRLGNRPGNARRESDRLISKVG